ncbi:MAG: diguanylate cyclase [Acidobacteriota bacterium]
MLPSTNTFDERAATRSVASVEAPTSGAHEWAGRPGEPSRPAFAEESSSLVHSASTLGDGLRQRARWSYCALSLTPLAVVGAVLVFLGASPAQLTAVAVVAGLTAGFVWRMAARHSRVREAWLTRVSEECCAIDTEWRYREGRLRTDPTMPAEIRRFFRDVDRMARRLDGSMERLRTAVKEGEELRSQLEQVLHSREQEIQTRTVELQAANLDLERQARQDGLTGIANHRRFVEFADQVWRIGIRDGRPVSVIMIDVDHFKDFNDIYGHQAGDQCLRRVSAAIASIARRPLDLAARYGGEEFAIVLGQTEPEDALQLAEQARRAVVAEDIVHSGSSDYGVVTISLGVASLRPHRDAEVKTLISLADKALYRAKRNGRNRTAM